MRFGTFLLFFQVMECSFHSVSRGGAGQSIPAPRQSATAPSVFATASCVFNRTWPSPSPDEHHPVAQQCFATLRRNAPTCNDIKPFSALRDTIIMVGHQMNINSLRNIVSQRASGMLRHLQSVQRHQRISMPQSNFIMPDGIPVHMSGVISPLVATLFRNHWRLHRSGAGASTSASRFATATAFTACSSIAFATPTRLTAGRGWPIKGGWIARVGCTRITGC